jgi:hypothetical protein
LLGGEEDVVLTDEEDVLDEVVVEKEEMLL